MRLSQAENQFLTGLFWVTSCVGLITGIFFSIYYGIIACILLGLILGVYVDFAKLSDRIGVGITAFFIFIIIYGLTVFFIAVNIDSKVIVENEIKYNIRLLENKTIVFENENSIESIENVELYYKCKLENCSNLVKIVYIYEPTNAMFAKNIFPKQYTKYDVK